MKYTYGIHARARILERGISLKAVDHVLSENTEKMVVPSKSDPEIELVLGVFEGRGYAVIVNRHSYKIVTVRRAQPSEEKRLKGEGLL